MLKKGRIFDLIFIVLAAIILMIINNFCITDNLFKYSLIAVLIAYYAGRYVTVISLKNKTKKE